MTVRNDLALASGRTTTALVRGSGRVAGSIFSQLGSWRDTDVPAYVQQITPVLNGAKREVSQSTVAFYQSIARLTGQDFQRPVITASDLSTQALRNGITSDLVYRRPFVDLRRKLADGSQMSEAIEAGARRANLLAQTEIELAKRNVGLKVRQANQNIVGYIRTLTGSENCALCYVASTQRYRKGDLLPIHPGCDCGEMPLYGTDDPGQVIDQTRLDATHEAVNERFGRFDLSARDIDYRQIRITNHGEMGPMLSVSGHTFKKAKNLDVPTELPVPDLAAGQAVDLSTKSDAVFMQTAPSPDAFDALTEYQGTRYKAMNRVLRTGEEAKGLTGEFIDDLKSMFSISRTHTTVTVQRGVGLEAFQPPSTVGLTADEASDLLDNHMAAFKGGVFEEKAFMSTTMGGAAPVRSVRMEIEVPEGTPAVDVNHVLGEQSAFSTEKELILPPGTRVNITEVDSDRFGYVVKGRVVQEGTS